MQPKQTMESVTIGCSPVTHLQVTLARDVTGVGYGEDS